MARGITEECVCIRKAWGKGDDEKALALMKVFTPAVLSRWYRARRNARATTQREMLEDNWRQDQGMSTSGVLALLGDASDAAVNLCRSMDVQFNFECDLLEGRVEPPRASQITLSPLDVFQNPNNYEMTPEQSRLIEGWRGIQIDGLQALRQGMPTVVPRHRGLMMVEAFLLLYRALEACGEPPGIQWNKLNFPAYYWHDLEKAVTDSAVFARPDDAMKVIAMNEAGIRSILDTLPIK